MDRDKQSHENSIRRHLLPILLITVALIIVTLAILSILQVIPFSTASILSLLSIIAGILSFLIPFLRDHYRESAPASLEKSIISASNIVKPGDSAESSIWYIPYRRNAFFTGRKEILKQLHDKLTKTNDLTQLQPQILSGLGGIGKTQIALEFAFRYQHEYPFILWLRTETRSLLISDIGAIPNLFPSQESEAETDELQERTVISSFRLWLASHKDWLLILDNVDDLQIVHELLPTKGKGHVLVTTRIHAVGNAGNRIEIENMNQEEGILFLLRRAKKIEINASLDQISEKEREDAQAIVEALEGLPLALDQAGAFIEETQSSLSEYCDLLATAKEKILLRRGTTSSDHPESVASTFSLSFQKVEQGNAGAADLLRLFAFLSPDAIPEELIKEGAQKLNFSLHDMATDLVVFNEAITTLLKYSLIRRNPNTQTITIHRLVQVTIKNIMDEDTQLEWTKQAIYAVDQAFPKEIDSLEKRERRKSLLPQVQHCFTLIEQSNLNFPEAVSLLNKAKSFLLNQERYAESLSFSVRLLKMQEQLLGAESPEVAYVLNSMAISYRGLNQYELAVSYYQRAIAIRQKILGQNDPETLRSLSNLGFLYYKQGNYEKAEQITKEVLALREQTIGANELSTATSLNILGLVYTAQGKFEEAEALYNRALAIRLQLSKPSSGSPANTLNNLGNLYMKQGKYDQAEIYFQKAITIREQRFMGNTVVITSDLLDLAKCYKAQNLYKKAEPFIERALSILEDLTGLQPSKMIEVLESYIDLLEKTGRKKEAKEFGKRLADIKEEANP
ncbi:MAG TPA: tetratricopeptide repeat protein [Methylomirabilota bacterium]|nr:tetratricopeptide repeat protein [Methylomirabilota bacterium]